MFKKSLLQFIRPSGSEVYNIHDSIGLKYLTRLRLEFSHLREHKLGHNFQDTLNPLCSCNLLESETVNHFLLLCRIYASQRKILLGSIFELDAGIENLSNAKLAQLQTCSVLCRFIYIYFFGITSSRFSLSHQYVSINHSSAEILHE